MTSNCHYLCIKGVEIEGFNIWCSPFTPTFFNWVFNEDRGKPIKKYWKLIPKNKDILVTDDLPN